LRKLIFKKLNNKNVFLIIFVLVLAICFETFQQLFYIKRFNLYDNIDILTLLKNQIYRWIIWFAVGVPIVFFIKRDIKRDLNVQFFIKYFLLIVSLVFINVLLISIVQFLISEAVFSVSKFYSEYFLFYVFQKAPIYILGYIAVTIILFLKYSKELLQIEVQELIELKKVNSDLYNQLSRTNTDKAKVLNIKIGNKRKIIPVNEITWLEADDYCVRVHTTNNPSYTMRISLKALQEILNDDFLRVHRKGIVNMKKVKELSLSSIPSVLLINNEKVIISKSNLKKVKDYLEP
jgi:hypothetical protein